MLLHIFETRQWSQAEQPLDNDFKEFIQKRQIQCIHSNLIEN